MAAQGMGSTRPMTKLPASSISPASAARGWSGPRWSRRARTGAGHSWAANLCGWRNQTLDRHGVVSGPRDRLRDDFAPWGTPRIGKAGAAQQRAQYLPCPLRHTDPRHRPAGRRRRGRPDVLVDHPRHGKPAGRDRRCSPSEAARLRLYKLESRLVMPLESLPCAMSRAPGPCTKVTMAAKGRKKRGDWKDLEFHGSVYAGISQRGGRTAVFVVGAGGLFPRYLTTSTKGDTIPRLPA